MRGDPVVADAGLDRSPVDPLRRGEWGPVQAGVRNDWVTAHALAVLTAAGRLSA